MAWQERTELLLGKEQVEKLNKAHVLVVGLGGVGGYAAEQICRAGVGRMTIVDGDVVEASNRNRQIIALSSTTGQPKADVLSRRLLDINPELQLTVINTYLEEEKIRNLVDAAPYDYVVDCIDTLSPKVNLIQYTLSKGLRLVSSMGAGGKVDPSMVEAVDISKSHKCPLARMVRKRLHRGFGVRKGFQVVFSSEDVDKDRLQLVEQKHKRSTIGTISYMPAVFGIYVASVVLRGLLEDVISE